MSPFERSPKQLIDASQGVTIEVLAALRHGVQARLQLLLPVVIHGHAFDQFIAGLAASAPGRDTIPHDTVDLLALTVKGARDAVEHIATIGRMLTVSGVLSGQPPGNDQARSCIAGSMALHSVSAALVSAGAVLNWFTKVPPPNADPPLSTGHSPYLLHSEQIVEVYRAMVEEAQRWGIPFEPGVGLPADDERVAQLPDDVVSAEMGGLPADIGRQIHRQRAVWADTAMNVILAAGGLAKTVFVEQAEDPDRCIEAIRAVYGVATGFHRPAATMAQEFFDNGYPEARQSVVTLGELLQQGS